MMAVDAQHVRIHGLTAGRSIARACVLDACNGASLELAGGSAVRGSFEIDGADVDTPPQPILGAALADRMADRSTHACSEPLLPGSDGATGLGAPKRRLHLRRGLHGHGPTRTCGPSS